MAAANSSTVVVEAAAEDGEDDEWIEVYPQVRKASSKLSYGSCGKRKKHSRKLIRVPADAILSKVQQLQQLKTENAVASAESTNSSKTQDVKPTPVVETRNKLDLVLSGEASVASAT
ncbi:UNVERIFIED_CONTAM: hypothetical protein HDU68_002917, partial [Siphonaria sp. JEL0065]